MLAALLVLLPLLAVALLPLSLVQRYRVGTARRVARGWLAAVNVVTIALSTVVFLAGALFANLWIPRAFVSALAGLGGGGLLGLVALRLSRWESTRDTLHYTPSRWPVLLVIAAVVSRLAFGLWRGWHAWQDAPDAVAWIVASGAAGSLAAGAVVLGYQLSYWAGVRRRFVRHARSR